MSRVSPDQPFYSAGGVIIRARFENMWKHRDGTLTGDEEALHDMRVGSRRLRAALDVFDRAFPGDGYRRLRRLTALLTDELGAVRDHDVMLLELRKYRKGVPASERPGIDELVSVIADEREVARRGLGRFFDELEADDYAGRMRRMFGAERDDG